MRPPEPASPALLRTALILVRFVVFVPVTIVGLVVLVVRYGGLRRNRDATHLAVET